VTITGLRPGFIPAAELAAQAAAFGRTTGEYMLDLLEVARARAYAPISGFRVGAVALGASGSLSIGGNVEFPGLPLNASVHAEQAALATAWHGGETSLAALGVTAAPCGHCRQFLNELAGAADLPVVVAGHPRTTLGALLPDAFGPADLGLSGGLLTPQHHDLVLATPSDDPLTLAALEAADAAYAPYSATYAGVAVVADGIVYQGRYAESAAFNPSLSPLQAALVAVAVSLEPFTRIERAVLVETEGPASQRAATEALLAVVAPKASLTYVRAVDPAAP